MYRRRDRRPVAMVVVHDTNLGRKQRSLDELSRHRGKRILVDLCSLNQSI